MGKTRLAVEYAWRYLDDYSAVLWVVSGTPDEMKTNFADLASPQCLDLPEYTATETRIVVAAVVKWLHTHSRWLPVFDNADIMDVMRDICSLIPTLGGKGHVIITSRLSHWSPSIKSIPRRCACWRER